MVEGAPLVFFNVERRITGRAGIGDRRTGRFAGDRTSVLTGHLAANDAEPRLYNHANGGTACERRFPAGYSTVYV